MQEETSPNTWELVVHTLERYLAARSSLCSPPRPDAFSAASFPAITLRNYLDRIHAYANCSPCCYVVAFIYLDRMLQISRFMITPMNIHRLILCSVLLAIKYCDDMYANNTAYALIGGVSLEELNGLEREMLGMLRFRLFVSTETYYGYLQGLKQKFREGLETGRRSETCVRRRNKRAKRHRDDAETAQCSDVF
ncbi:MAG: cyclin family protein [Candidatus Pacebacteria bacterium]|nr:cyclin family protein [Candidatus Paceibacterota bacterium]